MGGGTATENFGASSGTRSFTETEDIKTRFPSVFDDIETVYVQCEGPCSIPNFEDLIDKFSQGMAPYLQRRTVVNIISYFNFTGALSVLKYGYYNETAKSMFATMELSAGASDGALDEAVQHALDLATTLSSDSMNVYVTGSTSNRLLSTAAAGKVIGITDGTGFIFIILLFGWQVGSWRLTLIPSFNTGCVLLITEALIYPLSASGAITLPSYVTSVCLFLSIALSVDYSFFHLSRFQELRKEGATLEEAVEAMVRTAGRVVLVSGVVLLFTWLALAFFPVFGTNTLGYCSAITIFVCILVNLTMNPAIIFAFPNFFGRTALDPWRCCRCRGRAPVDQAPLTAVEDVTKNCYGSVARAIVKMPCSVIVPIIVYIILLPGAVRLFNADLVVGGVSGGTAKTEYATDAILRDFPNSQGGVPLVVLLDAPVGDSVKTSSYFAASCHLMQIMSRDIGVSLDNFRGIAIEDGVCIGWPAAEQKLNSTALYGYGWQESVNPANTSTLMTVSLPFDAFSNEAKALVTQSRDAVDSFSSDFNSGTAAVFHPMAVEVDAEELVWKRIPYVVLATLLVVFVVIALRYRAALIPVKLFFTIALPIVSVLGTGVFVFQDGALNWTGIPSLKSAGGLVWINPVACTFMLIGFALDYDIFLFSRIYADRKAGVFNNDVDAIVHAVAKTGPVITTAGCIMALAFTGMVAQHSNPFLCQMGFTMIFGILMDTFVVRTLLVPAFLSLAGRFNWWPAAMPQFEEQLGDQNEISLRA